MAKVRYFIVALLFTKDFLCFIGETEQVNSMLFRENIYLLWNIFFYDKVKQKPEKSTFSLGGTVDPVWRNRYYMFVVGQIFV